MSSDPNDGGPTGAPAAPPAAPGLAHGLKAPPRTGRVKRTGKTGRPAGSTKFTLAQIERALIAAGGIYADACRELNRLYGRPCSRSAMTRYIDASPRLQEVLEAVDEAKLDYCESLNWKKIEGGDVRCLHYYMTHKGHARGWGKQRHEVGGEGGKAIPFALDWSKLPVDTLKQLRDALRPGERS
jgi:hypothetical protein